MLHKVRDTLVLNTYTLDYYSFTAQCIHKVHLNKSPLKIWDKRERGRNQYLPKFFQCPLLSQKWEMLRTSNFVCAVIGSI